MLANTPTDGSIHEIPRKDALVFYGDYHLHRCIVILLWKSAYEKLQTRLTKLFYACQKNDRYTWEKELRDLICLTRGSIIYKRSAPNAIKASFGLNLKQFTGRSKRRTCTLAGCCRVSHNITVESADADAHTYTDLKLSGMKKIKKLENQRKLKTYPVTKTFVNYRALKIKHQKMLQTMTARLNCYFYSVYCLQNASVKWVNVSMVTSICIVFCRTKSQQMLFQDNIRASVSPRLMFIGIRPPKNTNTPVALYNRVDTCTMSHQRSQFTPCNADHKKSNPIPYTYSY